MTEKESKRLNNAVDEMANVSLALSGLTNMISQLKPDATLDKDGVYYLLQPLNDRLGLVLLDIQSIGAEA